MLDVIEFEACGKQYAIRPDFRAMTTIERKTGQGIIKLAAAVAEGNVGTAEIMTVLSVALGQDRSEEAKAVVSDVGIIEALQIISRFLEVGLGPPKKPTAPAGE